MAKLLDASAYRSLDRPYTRKSKYKSESYVRAVPHNKIVRFVMGDRQGDYEYVVKLKVKEALQIRHDAIEAARNTCNRLMEESIPEQYRFTIRTYPHHVLRNNPTASGAGADRMSTGMKHSFGEPIGIAAQLDENQTIFQIEADKDDVPLAKQALHRARKKLPCGCRVLVEQQTN